jgi:hypothetical protein
LAGCGPETVAFREGTSYGLVRIDRCSAETYDFLLSKQRQNIFSNNRKIVIRLHDITFQKYSNIKNTRGHAVAQLVEALRYKSEYREFDSRWYHWNFSLT